MLPSSHPTLQQRREHEPTLVGVGLPAIVPYKEKGAQTATLAKASTGEKTREDSLCDVSLSEVEVVRTAKDVDRPLTPPTASSWLRADPAFALLMCSAALLALFAIVASTAGGPVASSSERAPSARKPSASAQVGSTAGSATLETATVPAATAETTAESELAASESAQVAVPEPEKPEATPRTRAQSSKRSARARALAAKAALAQTPTKTGAARTAKTVRPARNSKAKRAPKPAAAVSAELSIGTH